MTQSNDLAKLSSIANGVYSSVTTNATAITSISVGGTSLNSTSFPGNANSATYLGNSSGTVANISSWVTGNAATAYTNATVFASNASNITTGTLPLARLDANVVNTSGNFTISGVHTHTANIDITNDRNLRFQTVNTSVYVSLRQQSDDNFVFYSSNTTGGERAVFSIYANSVTSNLIMYPSLQLTSAVVANGSNGTAGQALTSNGTGVYWATAGSSTLVYLSTVTASGATTVDVETTFDSTYDAYKIICSGATTSASAYFRCRFKIDGSYQTTGYYSAYAAASSAGVGAWTANSNEAQADICPQIATGSGRSFSFEALICNPSSTSLKKYMFVNGYGNDDNNNGVRIILAAVSYSGATSTTAALTGVRFLLSTGTISGTFRLYGIKNS